MDISSLTFAHHPDGYYTSADHIWVIRPGGSGWVLDLGGAATSEEFRLLYQEKPGQMLVSFPAPAAAVHALSKALQGSSPRALHMPPAQVMSHLTAIPASGVQALR